MYVLYSPSTFPLSQSFIYTSNNLSIWLFTLLPNYSVKGDILILLISPAWNNQEYFISIAALANRTLTKCSITIHCAKSHYLCDRCALEM